MIKLLVFALCLQYCFYTGLEIYYYYYSHCMNGFPEHTISCSYKGIESC